MRFQIFAMAAGVLVAIVALLFSKYVRAVTKESIARPRDRCEIEIADGNVSVKSSEPPENLES